MSAGILPRRKEAEDALRASELRFRMYTEGSLVGVHVTQDDRFVYVNPVFAQIFGYTTPGAYGWHESVGFSAP